MNSVEEYNKNTWNDIQKYIKRKVSTKTDDKIAKIRNKEDDEIENEEDMEIKNETDGYKSDISLSSDDLQHDDIKVKKRKRKNDKNAVSKTQYEQDVYTYDENLNFYQMNLSRPLLKAITQMKFTHPTPIQAATIPVALLGKLLPYRQKQIQIATDLNFQAKIFMVVQLQVLVKLQHTCCQH